MRGRRLTTVVIGTLLAVSAIAACGDDGDGGGDAAASADLSPAAQRGVEVANDKGCNACHSIDGARSMGPTWAGLAGSEVELDDGSTVRADRDYLEQAILDPRSQVRAGYANIMPTAYQLGDEELDALITLIEELSE